MISDKWGGPPGPRATPGSPLFLLALLAAALALVSCKSAPPSEKLYDLRGQIVSLNAETKTATIKHEKIGDWMDAMTMEFPVRNPAEFARMQPNQKITAKVHVQPDSFQYWITDVRLQ